ncbi:hypothetical protein OH805_21740 [Streptomyces sp. NBC_00879]|uniref:hypothetical protein n=1 Tax=Streptomyces sp. NBC_00879 TaxID=2975855 RepID=UPI00386FE523|nr:hypothetical protein OH805_21740 [Streptomyces sp. NBC_00879]
MVKLTVSTHKLFGYGGTLRTAKRLAEQAVTVVDRSVPGRMPDVQITSPHPGAWLSWPPPPRSS